ncbi:hypothetical protein O988_05636 [Pseudogymnoascus sp. VKM F-3808]|nr:hypothetical protein O988_05636 [Pseudogymnoascus sp. VKM F-3808]
MAPAMTSLPMSNHCTATLTGTPILVHTWTAATLPRKAIVILQHGYGEYSERYVSSHHALVLHLTSHGFEVHAMDMYGHGDSPGPRGVVHVGKAVSAHVHLRHQISKQKENENVPIFIFGHSLGGLVTAGSLVEDPENVQGIILTGPAFPAPLPTIARCILGLVTALLPKRDIPVPRQPISGLSSLPEEQKIMEDDEGLLKRNIPFLVAATALEVMGRIRYRLDRWKTPTLLMHGTEDRYTDPSGSRVIFGGIASADKSLRLYPGGRHELLNDADCGKALTEVLEWLEDQIK